MDIFKKYGTKERLFEMFQNVNKVNVVENKIEKKVIKEEYNEWGLKVKKSRVNEAFEGDLNNQNLEVLDWDTDNNGNVIITFENGNKEMFYYHDEDSEGSVDYHVSAEGGNGTLIYRNEDGSLEAKFKAYSSTGNPDSPDWEIEDVISVEPVQMGEGMFIKNGYLSNDEIELRKIQGRDDKTIDKNVSNVWNKLQKQDNLKNDPISKEYDGAPIRSNKASMRVNNDIEESFDNPKEKDKSYLNKSYNNVQASTKYDDAPIVEAGFNNLGSIVKNSNYKEGRMGDVDRNAHVDDFKNNLKSKYGVDDISELSPAQYRELLQGMGKVKPVKKQEFSFEKTDDIEEGFGDEDQIEGGEFGSEENIEADTVDNIEPQDEFGSEEFSDDTEQNGSEFGGEDKIEGGLADDKSSVDFDPEQILKGMKIEMEHTDDPQVALEIAMDHLTEIPDYYDHLEDMEVQATGADAVDAMGDGEEGEAAEEITGDSSTDDEESDVLWGKMNKLGEPEEEIVDTYKPRGLGENIGGSEGKNTFIQRFLPRAQEFTGNAKEGEKLLDKVISDLYAVNKGKEPNWDRFGLEDRWVNDTMEAYADGGHEVFDNETGEWNWNSLEEPEVEEPEVEISDREKQIARSMFLDDSGLGGY